MDARANTALLVVDMLNSYDHDDAEPLAESAKDAVGGVQTLLEHARGSDVPIVYVNDNRGDWNSSPRELADRALGGEHPELVKPVLPPDGAAFVIKARHSIFFGTPLEYLLWRMEVGRIVLTGQVTEQCILYSALDAHVRHLDVCVATDAVAHIHENLAEAALEMMERNMGAELVRAADCDLRG